MVGMSEQYYFQFNDTRLVIALKLQHLYCQENDLYVVIYKMRYVPRNDVFTAVRLPAKLLAYLYLWC